MFPELSLYVQFHPVFPPFLDEKKEEGIQQKGGYNFIKKKNEEDGAVHIAMSPPKTFCEDNWNYKHALSVFLSMWAPKSSIIIFINGVRFPFECKNKDFSLEAFPLWVL